jgi:hypothetical protein
MGLKLGKKIEGGLRKLEEAAIGVERAAARGAQDLSTVARDLSRGGGKTASKGLHRLEEAGRRARTKADQLADSARAAAEELRHGLEASWEAGMEARLGRLAWQTQHALREARDASGELASVVRTPVIDHMGRGRIDLAWPAELGAAVESFRQLGVELEGAAAGAEELVSSAQAFLASQGRDLAEVWEAVKESELFRAGVDALARILMDKPTLHHRPEGCAGPVYYVNGMLTPLDKALSRRRSTESGTFLSTAA